MGSKNCAELLKANKIHPKEAEILFYITNNISPVFIGSYILLQQLQLTGMFGISIFILYVPALILGMLLLHRKKEENRQKKTASQSQITFKIIDAAIMNGFETLVRIGGYIMLFSILISLVEKLPLPKPVLILLENVLEITNGINCLANTDWSIQTKYILAMTATAFGGLSGIAQTSSMVKGTSLSMKTDELVSEHQIMQQAYAQANEVVMIATKQAQEILDNATNDANNIRMGALQYTDDILRNLEISISHAMDSAKARHENYMSSPGLLQ